MMRVAGWRSSFPGSLSWSELGRREHPSNKRCVTLEQLLQRYDSIAAGTVAAADCLARKLLRARGFNPKP